MDSELANAAKEMLLVLGALLPIVNPLGSAPIFLSMTSWAPTEVRQVLASRIAVNVFVLVLASIFFGSYILGLFGISLSVVQVGGGLLVAAAGWRLLSPGAEKLSDDAKAWSADEVIERAFYPLTFPLTVGPGSISVAITLGANTMRRHMPLWAFIGALLTATALVAVAVYFCYRFAYKMPQLLGENGMRIFLRLSAFILLCIGVQILWNGVTGLIVSLPHVNR
jgi:multiple antibiotic resistance protein